MADAVSTENVVALAYPPDFDCPKAGEIINAVRDLGPDPVYDELTGEPLPDEDGSFLRASTLYRWLTNGIRELARRANWVVIDWTAVAQTTGQAVYYLPYRFANIDAVFCNQFRLAHLDEVHTIYPSVSVAQPLWYATHHRSDHVELALWPYPDRQDPGPPLMSPMDPVSTSMDLTTTAGFLPNGYVRVEAELMHYSALGPPTAPGLRTIRRAVGGTVATTHFAGTKAEHLGIWARGWRAPIAVKQARDCVEVPFAFQAPLETYLLAKYREAEQDRQAAASLMQEFSAMVNDILIDPVWQNVEGHQVQAYGMAALGGLAYGRVVVP
jgi:hypothetical protein